MISFDPIPVSGFFKARSLRVIQLDGYACLQRAYVRQEQLKDSQDYKPGKFYASPTAGRRTLRTPDVLP
jgi:hypothetical protein